MPATQANQLFSHEEIVRARSLHAMLLFDFIVVHIFLFLGGVTLMKNSLIPLALVPVISISMLCFVLIKAHRAKNSETSAFVLSHLLLSARRAKLFLLLFFVTGTFSSVIYFGGQQLGISKIATMALAGGVGQLPFMVAILALVVLEFDADHQAKLGRIPAAARKLLPAAMQQQV